MKVLIVTQYFWPENFRINDLALGLRDRGHHVAVLTGIPNYPEGKFFPGHGFFKNTREDFHGVKIRRVPLLARGGGGRIRLALNYLSFAFTASLLAPFWVEGKHDVIFVFEPSPVTVGLPALVLKKVKSVPILFWVQDLWPESLSATGAVRSRIILNAVEKLVRFIYEGCDRILVTSQAFFAPLGRLGVDPGRISYFPQSAEVFNPAAAMDGVTPERVGMPDGFRVVFAGNIGAAQDFDTILAAAEILREHRHIHWVIIGDGRMRPWVEQQVRQRNLVKTVHLLGRYPVEDMPRFFSLADVLLVTLKRDPIFKMTVPAKIQSYLACGKPIVAALDGEGARMITEAGAGLSCPAEDPQALADAVLAMHRLSDDERGAMGRSGKIYYASNFERNMLLDRLEGWMRELAKGDQGTALPDVHRRRD